MGALAAAAGVTRQTVYSHFASREELLAAALDRVTEESVAAMDAADLDEGPAPEALLRLIEAGSEVAQRHRGLIDLAARLPEDEVDHDRHVSINLRLIRVIRRGQESGEFDPDAEANWLATAVIALAHAAGRQAAAGRMEPDRCQAALRVSLMRLLGATGRDQAA